MKQAVRTDTYSTRTCTVREPAVIHQNHRVHLDEQESSVCLRSAVSPPHRSYSPAFCAPYFDFPSRTVVRAPCFHSASHSRRPLSPLENFCLQLPEATGCRHLPVDRYTSNSSQLLPYNVIFIKEELLTVSHLLHTLVALPFDAASNAEDGRLDVSCRSGGLSCRARSSAENLCFAPPQ